MPTLEITASTLGPSATMSAPEGGRLLDVLDESGEPGDEARAPIAFSCRGATCGSCRVEVLAGAELLEPPERDERETLALVGAPASDRLACQAIVRAGHGHVVLRPR
jgi:2Fe-2S ferredoxin